MIESLIAIFLIGLIFFGILQVSLVFTAREVLHHAAARGARAKTVGFNDWMCRKAVRVATIPISGAMIAPDVDTADPWLQAQIATKKPGQLWDTLKDQAPASRQLGTERARIPHYLDAGNRARARYILDYAGWDEGFTVDIPQYPSEAETLEVTVEQSIPLEMPMHRAFYGADHVLLQGRSSMETHYPLYLEDQGW